MRYTVEDVDRVIESDFEIPVTYGSGYSTSYTPDDGSMWSLLKDQEINDVPTELGVISYVADHGGEGKGDDYWVVVKITDANGDVRHFKRLGWYASYDGGELDGPTVEVKPQERMIVVYEG